MSGRDFEQPVTETEVGRARRPTGAPPPVRRIARTGGARVGSDAEATRVGVDGILRRLGEAAPTASMTGLGSTRIRPSLAPSRPADGDALLAAGAQAKLQVGAADDPAEREADRVAQRVVAELAGDRATDALSHVVGAPGASRIRRRAVAAGVGPEGGPAAPEVEDRIRGARGSGSALPRELGSAMGQSLGTDLSGVRVHHDERADSLNRSLSSRAFTLGSDVFFAAGEYQPESATGQHLIAHEVAHVVQQTGAARRTIRRLPEWNWVKQQVGDPKTGSNLFGREKSKDYKAFGTALQAYNNACNVAIAQDVGGRTAQYLAINTRLDAVRAAVAKYNKTHKTDARARMVTGIGSQCRLEKAVLTTRKTFLDAHGPQQGQTWKDLLPESMGTHLFDLGAEGNAGGQQAGGINTVTKYDLPGGFTGFNKFAEKQVRAGTPEEGITQDLFIPANDPRMNKRAIAMWRIDQLLNANVLTRTERTLDQRYGKYRGVVSEAAGGDKFATRGNQAGEFYATDAQRQADPAAKPDAFTGDDPVLQRCLAKLTVVDALCGQVDRHGGNWYVQTDGAGNVLGVVGIDNDLAFPEAAGPSQTKKGKALKTWEDVTKAYREFPGVGLYFDWETAEMVLALNPADLTAIVADLLPPGAVAVLLGRLTSLKAEILQAKNGGRLLNPNQWGAAINPKGQGAAKESGGYLKDVVR